ncbi:hypothetical protein Vretifemale_19079 [Volvox reticuliferus]|uniref:Uncharacterized protein n=1 Tax=Volvox reticuliferus TaxID=1737510 RepID=A0A8J4CX11_9CHLO|nr:hypothetical protein Vretifemale_19079 [Volvox reticuliferus]
MVRALCNCRNRGGKPWPPSGPPRRAVVELVEMLTLGCLGLADIEMDVAIVRCDCWSAGSWVQDASMQPSSRGNAAELRSRLGSIAAVLDDDGMPAGARTTCLMRLRRR